MTCSEFDAQRARPWLLAIDTATPQAGIAITDGADLAVTTWPGGRQQTISTPVAIDDLLNRCGIELALVGCLAVSIGPGSFTGLRVGLSLAKGLAMMPQRDLVAVSTLQAQAEPYLQVCPLVVPVIPAGRGRIVWSVAQGGAVGAPTNSSLAEFIERVSALENAVVIGEIDCAMRNDIEYRGIQVAPAGVAHNRVAAVATIAFDMWRRLQLVDADELQPVYVHGRPNPR